jgi:hypothetical protein
VVTHEPGTLRRHPLGSAGECSQAADGVAIAIGDQRQMRNLGQPFVLAIGGSDLPPAPPTAAAQW